MKFNKKSLLQNDTTNKLANGNELVIIPCKSRQELITNIEKIQSSDEEGRNNKKFIFRLEFEDASWLFEGKMIPDWVNFEFTYMVRKMNGMFRKASIPYHVALQLITPPNNIKYSIDCCDEAMVYKVGDSGCTYATFLNKQTKK